MKKRITIAAALAAAFISFALASCKQLASDDPVEYSFVVVGGCRMAKGDTNTATNPSTSNIVQLDRTLEDITQLTPKPKYVFFMGDEIFGYQRNPDKLAAMLRAWLAHCEASPAMKASITLVPVLGNHESQEITPDGKRAYPGAEAAWLKVMWPKYIYGDNGPHAGGPDSLETDQSKLTYSFNYRDTHFVILNTDPAGQDAHVPVHWVENDLTQARKDGAKHIFAIGHKPAFGFEGQMGLVGENRTPFWAAMEANHAEAMLASHFHVYSRFQPHYGKTWMVISGNGGSPFEDNLRPDQQYFGFTLVSVLKSGKVIVKSYGRNVPPGPGGYAAPDPADKYPTTVRDSADITWKG